ncbi:MAG: energy transducer TonB [Alphaproteobacteria bacterium]|nr:energy transducer TonB [Alphaproteobacteria bacterium]
MKIMLMPLVILLLLAMPAQAGTVQQDFDAAQTHLDGVRLAEARAGFAALLERLGASKGRSAMIVRSRLGETMIAMGDVEEAQPLLEAALAGLPAGVAAVADERAGVLTHLARAAEEQGKLRDALGHWQMILTEALLPPTSLGGLQARLGAARTGLWTQPQAAAALIDGLLAEPASVWGAQPQAGISGRLLVLRLKGQLAMHLGRLDEARRTLDEAGKLAGGTATLQVNLDDVQLRGDLAVLAWLKKDMASVVRLTAMSGNSMLDDNGRRLAGVGDLPPCAPSGSLAPDAMAVIEFSVRDDGRVLNVRPIFASPGSGPAGSHPEEEFTAAVHGWSWPADQASATSPLWRAAIRVEVRCMTQQPDLITATLAREQEAWFKARGLATPPPAATAAQTRQQLIAALAAVDAAGNPDAAAALPLLAALVQNPAHGASETLADAARLDALAERHDAPAYLRFVAQWRTKRRGDMAGQFRRLVQLADQRGEVRTADYLRLLRLEYSMGGGDESELDAIAARHGEADPLRTKALIMLSDRAFARGEEAKASAALAATGLSPQQCALVDVRPQGRNAFLSTDDFPREAQAWGLSAMMRVAHDVTPAGDMANVRVISARPPFAFSDQTVKRMQSWKFKPVLRGTQSVGCLGRVQPIRFRLN